MNDEKDAHGAGDNFRPLIEVPPIWAQHRLFRDAPEITERQVDIDAVRNPTVRSNAEVIYALFQVRPHWPAYDKWSQDRLSAGETVTVFGPLEPTPKPRDILPYATLASLRRVAMEHGIKPRRSKVQITEQLRQTLGAPMLVDLENEGDERWSRFEGMPSELTFYAVLDHTIQMIQNAARDEVLYKGAHIRTLVWLSRGGSDTCALCRNAEGVIVSVGDAVPGIDTAWPPAHPGCACSTMAADPDVRPSGLEDLIDARRQRGNSEDAASSYRRIH